MKKEPTMPNFVKNEEAILRFWQDNQIFEKMKKKNEGSKDYFAFLDGPITANYPMGLHHTWNRSLKDIMLKFAGLSGRDAHYQNGFDCHGLPVELSVEKQLGLDSKKDIEKYGMANFIEACMERIRVYSKKQTEQSIRLGQWMDWNDSYYTNSDSNITAIWYFLKECQKKGWITESYRPTPWCTRCGTALSEHEMADIDAYKELEHMAVFIKLPVKDSNLSLVVWTTTPWTLSSNVAVAVNPELKYSICKVKSTDRRLVVCNTALKILKDDLVEVEKEVLGSELVGLSYETCFPELKEQDFEHKVVAWDSVDATEGSGMVHIAPGCGAEDFDLGQSLGLKNIVPIDEAGNFYEGFGFLTGKNANEVAELVFEELKKRDKLYYTHKYKHRYPHCWRCKHPVLFRLVKNWVIKMDEIRPALIKAIDDVVFQPEFMKKRMLDWLTNMGDWSISRKRYYGVPLPFYVCKECGKLTVVGSLKELEELSSSEEVKKLPHLHRPYIDEIKIRCPHCGASVERIPEVGDCWLDAGITPFSTKKYFTDEEFFNKNFPTEVVLEGKEQIRLWFYSLLVMSMVITGKAPYKKIVCTAMLLDREGKKLSKSSPNNISVDEAFETIGADIIRYLFASNNMMSDVRFSFDLSDEIRRTLLSFWNSYAFFNTYACLDNPKLEGYKANKARLDVTDRWLIEKTNKFIREAKENYSNQRFYLVTESFENFIDELSNWYIRVNRRRFWKSDYEEDKLNAYYCLYYALKNIVIVMAPILPFLSEYLWQNMVRELEPKSAESVFLNGFAETGFEVNDEEIIELTTIARDIITIAQRLRNENQIKIKQPLRAMYLVVDGKAKKASRLFENIIKEELNIKSIIFEEDKDKFNTAYLTVNFKTAGAAMKGDVQKLKNMLASADEKRMQELVESYKKGKVETAEFGSLDSSLFILNLKAKTDFVIATEENRTVVLDITLDESLLIEGLSRELIRAIQVLRKEAGFKVEDRVYLALKTDSQTLKRVVFDYTEKIMAEVLALELFEELENAEVSRAIVVGDEEITISMRRVEEE